MKITSKKSTGGGLPAGNYVGTIVSIASVKAAAKEGYVDPTDQFHIVLETEDGRKQNHWLNVKGYMRYSDLSDAQKKSKKFIAAGDEGYAVDKATKMRVISEKATEACENILNNFAFCAGVEEGEDVELDDLIDREIGFAIVMQDGYSRVKAFMPADAVEA